MASRLKASSRDGDSPVGPSAARVGAVAWTGDGSSAESRPSLPLGACPLAPERNYENLFSLTAKRLAHERGWGREALGQEP